MKTPTKIHWWLPSIDLSLYAAIMWARALWLGALGAVTSAGKLPDAQFDWSDVAAGKPVGASLLPAKSCDEVSWHGRSAAGAVHSWPGRQ